MSDLIEREAALRLVDEYLDPIIAVVSRGGNGGSHRKQLLAEIRSLPAAVPVGACPTCNMSLVPACPQCAQQAAVPVADLQKAADEYYRQTYKQVKPASLADRCRAILDAGYAGSVSVEDLRDVATSLNTMLLTGKLPVDIQPGQALGRIFALLAAIAARVALDGPAARVSPK